MWEAYGWLIWVALGGLFLYLMFRHGGCGMGRSGHDGRGGHEEHGTGGHVGHEGPAQETGNPRSRKGGGCC